MQSHEILNFAIILYMNLKGMVTTVELVASGAVGMDLNLNVLAMKLENTEYEPEQFPGLVYKLPHAKATFLLLWCHTVSTNSGQPCFNITWYNVYAVK